MARTGKRLLVKGRHFLRCQVVLHDCIGVIHWQCPVWPHTIIVRRKDWSIRQHTAPGVARGKVDAKGRVLDAEQGGARKLRPLYAGCSSGPAC
jgi:hypothetical protein